MWPLPVMHWTSSYRLPSPGHGTSLYRDPQPVLTSGDLRTSPSPLTSGGYWSTSGWQAGSMHPTGMLSCFIHPQMYKVKHCMTEINYRYICFQKPTEPVFNHWLEIDINCIERSGYLVSEWSVLLCTDWYILDLMTTICPQVIWLN